MASSSKSRRWNRCFAVATLAALVSVAVVLPGSLTSPVRPSGTPSSGLTPALGGTLPHIVPIVLSSPTPGAYGQFGTSVAISGTTLVVGAPYETAGGFAAAGHVWVIDLQNGSSTDLSSPNAQSNGDFGYAVGINGTNLVIGAPFEVGLTLSSAGNAYLYNLTTRTFVATLTDAHPAANGNFGASVAIGPSYIAVGAPGETAAGDTGAGRAYTFDASTGTPVSSIASPWAKRLGASGGGEFGFSVAVSGSTVAVGAPLENGTSQSTAGNAYLFNAGTGAHLATLRSGAPQAYGFFGWSVALSPTRVAVGAPFETGGGIGLAGNAYLFNATTYARVATLTSPNAQADGLFGMGLALAASTVIVGAPQESAGGEPDAGNAYNFSAAAGTLVATFANPEPQYNGAFGASEAIGGSTAAIGGPRENVSTTVQAGLTFVYGPLPDAVVSGTVVATSGATVVVGIPDATVAGLSDAGEAWVFNTTSGVVFLLTSPNNQVDGLFGYAVAANGTYVVIGAPYETVSGQSEAGNAYLYAAHTGTYLRTFAAGTVVTDQNFGYSVAVSDGRVVVGAPYATAPSSAGDVGQALVYNASHGGLVTTVTGLFLSFFACSVSISGSLMVIGALLDEEAFVYNAGTGTLISTLTPPTSSVTNLFGTSVGISGTTVVVGAPVGTAGKHKGAGNAYLFNATSGKRTAHLTNSDPFLDGHYGEVVAISGTTVVVGAPGESIYGMAYVITTTTLAAIAVTDPTEPYGFEFGQAVAVCANTIVIASTGETEVY